MRDNVLVDLPRRLWAAAGAYDHVVLGGIMGPSLMDWPALDGWPYHTNDLYQELGRAGLTWDDLPKAAVEAAGEADGIEYEIVGEGVPPERTVEDLHQERARLLAQLADLDAELERRDPEAAAAERARRDAEARQVAEEQAEQIARAHRATAVRCRCGRHTCPPCGATPAEYARAVGHTTDTIYRWCRDGKVPAVRYRGRWIITAPVPAPAPAV